MNKEFLTKVKTANAEEHLKVTLKDVDIANSELSKVLKKTLELQKILTSFEESIEESSIKLSSINKESSDKLKAIENAKDNLENQSIELDKKKIKIDKEVQEKILIIIDLENKFNSNMVYYKNTITDFETKIGALNSNISKLESIEKDLLSSIKGSSKELTDIQNENSKKKEEKELLEKEYNRFVINSNKEKQEVAQLINVEKEKIANPMKLLLSTKSEVERRERDVGILIKGFRREFAKLHPTLNPII